MWGSRSYSKWIASPPKILPPSLSRCAAVVHNHLYSSQADISFEDYRKLRKTLKSRSRVAGIPLAFISMGVSSLINVQMNPGMFEMTPEEVQPIL